MVIQLSASRPVGVMVVVGVMEVAACATSGSCDFVDVGPLHEKAPTAAGKLRRSLPPGTRLSSSKHCRTSSCMPCSSQVARASMSSQKMGPQKVSSSRARRREDDQKSNLGLRPPPPPSPGWRRDRESRAATRTTLMVGSAWRTWLTTQAATLDHQSRSRCLPSVQRTWASSSHAPILFLHDKALQPGEGSTCFSAEDQLQIEDVATPPQGKSQSRCVTINPQHGEDQGMGDVALQQPRLFVMAGGRPVIGAKARQENSSVSTGSLSLFSAMAIILSLTRTSAALPATDE